MKKMSVAFLLGLTHLIAHAESKILEKPVKCDDAKTVIEQITGSNNLNEMPVWVGVDQATKSKYILTVNQRTRVWTFIQFGEKSACIIGYGEAAKLLNLGQNTKVIR